MKNNLKKISKYKPSQLQGTLQLEAMRPRASLAMEHAYERHALSILLIALALLIAGYLYFVTASILHVMARSEALRQTDKIESSIGELEQRYLALAHEVSPGTGLALGLAPVSDVSYVHREGNAAFAGTVASRSI